MGNIVLAPSMMCADFKNLGTEVDNLVAAKVDILHLDIMDGDFVPNFGMGLQDVSCIVEMARGKDVLVDVHLMIKNPSHYIELFAKIGVDIIYIHPEVDLHPIRTIQNIKALGKKAGIVISPSVALESVEELFPYVDYVMVMTVNPGFAGQAYLETMDAKIKKLLSEKYATYNFDVAVDGAISRPVISRLHQIGVKVFVLGTSTLFNKEKPYSEIIKEVREENTNENSNR